MSEGSNRFHVEQYPGDIIPYEVNNPCKRLYLVNDMYEQDFIKLFNAFKKCGKLNTSAYYGISVLLERI